MSEYVSIDNRLDWTKANIIAAGVDIGAVSSKAVILLDGQPFAFSQVPTRMPKESCFKAMNIILEKTDLTLENIHYIVATGRGRTQVPFAHRRTTEILCATVGAVYIWGPSVRTVLDAGGQSCRVIHCTKRGRVIDFLWNDKCASGIGRSMETFASLAKIELNEIGNKIFQSENFPELSDFCPIYAQSEAFDLIRNDVPMEQVITAYHYAMAKRISTLVGRLGLKKDFVMIGGLAKNRGIVNRVENILGIPRLNSKIEWDPVFTIALGAALFADSYYRRQKSDPSTSHKDKFFQTSRDLGPG